MNVDRILDVLNRKQVACILIGGVNFLLRHRPVLTFDVDIWIDDIEANRDRCECALEELEAQWGRSDEDWRPVHRHPPGWLATQAVFCLSSPHGAIGIYREVAGLDDWRAARQAAYLSRTAGGVEYVGLSDEDMLRSQYALADHQRNQERVEILERAVGKRASDGG